MNKINHIKWIQNSYREIFLYYLTGHIRNKIFQSTYMAGVNVNRTVWFCHIWLANHMLLTRLLLWQNEPHVTYKTLTLMPHVMTLTLAKWSTCYRQDFDNDALYLTLTLAKWTTCCSSCLPAAQQWQSRQPDWPDRPAALVKCGKVCVHCLVSTHPLPPLPWSAHSLSLSLISTYTNMQL